MVCWLVGSRNVFHFLQGVHYMATKHSLWLRKESILKHYHRNPICVFTATTSLPASQLHVFLKTSFSPIINSDQINKSLLVLLFDLFLLAQKRMNYTMISSIYLPLALCHSLQCFNYFQCSYVNVFISHTEAKSCVMCCCSLYKAFHCCYHRKVHVCIIPCC